ncbi:MAG TPA: nuclear transport factor 2 family protein [Cyclobacteriaceae bacterium]|nr:nuclear transport factor 2 family protein [Cyclobacteriaceae bacterium]
MKLVSTILLAAISVVATAQPEEAEVKNVINVAYIGGIHNGGPVADIRKGFHRSFNMLRLMENEVKPLPIEEWIKNIEANRAKNPNAVNPKVEGKFISVSVAGTSASVVLELYREGKMIFTDHLLLYKFNEGWRIVSKIYYRYP